MLATFKISGFQYTASEGDVLTVPDQNLENGAKLKITEVLLVEDPTGPKIGTPFIANAVVEAEVVKSGLGEKILIMKYKRRTKYRRTQGHRQPSSEIKITRIYA